MRAQPALDFAGGGRSRRPLESAASIREVARRASCSPELSADARVLAAVLALTAGWQRQTDAVVIDQVAELAGVHRDVARRTLRRLALAGVIVWRPVRGHRSLLGLPTATDLSGPLRADDAADHSGPLATDHSGPLATDHSGPHIPKDPSEGSTGRPAGAAALLEAPPEGLLEAVGRQLFTELGGVGRRELYAAWAESPERVRTAAARVEARGTGARSPAALLVTELRERAAAAQLAAAQDVAAVERRREARHRWAVRTAQEAPDVAWFVDELDYAHPGLEAAERASLIAEASTIIGGA